MDDVPLRQEAQVPGLRLLRRTWEVRIVRYVTLGVLAFGAASAVSRLLAKLFYDDLIWAFNGWFVPFDLLIFLNAGDAVLNGVSPYPTVAQMTGDFNYVYPPFLALVMTPLAALPHGVAATIFTTLSIGAIVGGLRLLGVTDWRCHVAALVSLPAHEALHWGTIVPFLVLLVALCWHFRDRPVASAAAAAGAIVLKLFLWPLLFWFVATRRVRAALLVALFAAGLALGSWAVIMFRGFEAYPRLLQKLNDLESERSFSGFALARSLGLPSVLAQLAVLAVGLGVLVLAYRAARSAEPARERDRKSLTLIIGAALLLTPILWFHGLLLLYVPIALARPRLSALWLAPLPLWVLFYFRWYNDWPDGRVVELLSVALFATLIIATSLWSGKVSIRPGLRRAQSSTI